MLKSATSTNPRFALAALAACAYAVGTTEFVIVGLLPTVARDTHATIASAGLLVSGYALAVTIGTPLLTALTSSFSRKATLLALMAVFVLGNIAAALAPGYGVLMAARLITGLAHGLFFSVGYMIADDLVPEEQRAGAVALVLTGLTVAVVTGVPLGTYIGQQFGWRATFWMVAVLGIVGLISAVWRVPAHLRPTSRIGWRDQWEVLRQGRLTLAFLITALGFTGTYVVFTYLVPMLERITRFPAAAASPLLIVYGVAVVLGNALGGRAADRQGPLRAAMLIFAIQAVVLLAFTVADRNKIAATIGVFLLGGCAVAAVSGIQSYVTDLGKRLAPNAVEAAGALNIASTNLGISAGSFLGGLVVTHLGLTQTPWVASLVILAALYLTARSSKRTTRDFNSA